MRCKVFKEDQCKTKKEKKHQGTCPSECYKRQIEKEERRLDQKRIDEKLHDEFGSKGKG